MGTVLCTHKRDFATVTLIPGRCFDRGGGGIGFYNNRGEESNFSIFPESLGPKESDWRSFQVDAPPQAILEPRRVRVTLIPGSTLVTCKLTPTKASLEPGPSRARYFPCDMLLLTTTAQERAWRLLKIHGQFFDYVFLELSRAFAFVWRLE